MTTVALSHYQQRIAAVPATRGVDPLHVEAWMRLEHPTLDHLSPGRFALSATIAAECARSAGPAECAALTDSLGF